VRRYIMTGAPGAGKTSILATLRARGYAVVNEAATDVIARELACGREHPGVGIGFIGARVVRPVADLHAGLGQVRRTAGHT
jgi:predicted ATPase